MFARLRRAAVDGLTGHSNCPTTQKWVLAFRPLTPEPLADDGRCYANVRPPRFIGILARGEGRLDAERDAAQEVAQTDDLRREPTVRGRVVIVDVRERDARRGPAEPDERRRLARAADE